MPDRPREPISDFQSAARSRYVKSRGMLYLYVGYTRWLKVGIFGMLDAGSSVVATNRYLRH